ncbi:hypothetical protein HGRIS_004579 [Hohenbuehelia grisea]|uniref:UBC core domain-containing protein n=1 Tax=Hohenbuehelia grisea TaxID=104357 RepID=A0ABR3JCG0_9AGAR
MASKAASKRLSKEFVTMQKEPPPFVWAAPDEKNILTWNFIIRGPADSPYAGGEYHGVLQFPSEYPFKPPGIKMFTPSGRFQPDKKICFSMSDFHPGSWNPAWSVATILTGLLSFMLSDEMTTGSVTSTTSHKRVFALKSHAWNISQARFKEAFPEYCTTVMRDLPNMGEKERGRPDPPPMNFPPSLLPNRMVLPKTASSATTSAPTVATTSVPVVIPVAPTPQASNAGSSLDKPRDVTATAGWAATWGQVLWEKWRWGVLIALAVIVSRFSSQ